MYDAERSKKKLEIENDKERNDQATLKNSTTHISIDQTGLQTFNNEEESK